MLQVKSEPKNDGDHKVAAKAVRPVASLEPTSGHGFGAQRSTTSPTTPPRKSDRPALTAVRPADSSNLQTRVPPIIGEAIYRGTVLVDGIISGQPGNNGGALSVRQRGRPFFGAEPELNGEISFRDMLRVNGHIAGSVFSDKGTLVVDAAAKVDANVDVAVAIIGGAVAGDLVAHQRVELRSTAKVYGNIWTRSLVIQRGAIFEGVCQMLEKKENI
jgi:cytoskeletal protein CcmA (bactofilin family)